MAMLRGVRCVLFDLDGTLVDSAPDLIGIREAKETVAVVQRRNRMPDGGVGVPGSVRPGRQRLRHQRTGERRALVGDPVEFGHLHVEHERIVGFTGQQPQRFPARRGNAHVEPGMPQTSGNRGPDIRVVVHHENRPARAVLGGQLPRASGRSIHPVPHRRA